MSFQKIVMMAIFVAFVPSFTPAQDQKVEESYRAFGVAMGAGMSGVLEFHITRWSTEEERKALIDSLVANGQEKTVELLRKQKETGWSRTQSGAGMRGWPSVRLHYAHQFPKPDGSRTIVLVTDRNMSIAEEMRNDRSVEYDVSALVMDMKKGPDGKEQGTGTLLLAAKLGFNKEKNQLEVESLGSLGQQPIRLTDIKREK
jgi:hypothetical protein